MLEPLPRFGQLTFHRFERSENGSLGNGENRLLRFVYHLRDITILLKPKLSDLCRRINEGSKDGFRLNTLGIVSCAARRGRGIRQLGEICSTSHFGELLALL